ncbi:hypothetical protein EYF80_054898 [Liparis tanakae]|uniref:Uncharacterized protein n=1 Tax=Liparis tanakae TaxID=230148 RepID=A0A4Z2F1M4_9TELE|nr:hypothetical protein EYF80_054898 [Liparis tanakae]
MSCSWSLNVRYMKIAIRKGGKKTTTSWYFLNSVRATLLGGGLEDEDEDSRSQRTEERRDKETARCLLREGIVSAFPYWGSNEAHYSLPPNPFRFVKAIPDTWTHLTQPKRRTSSDNKVAFDDEISPNQAEVGYIGAHCGPSLCAAVSSCSTDLRSVSGSRDQPSKSEDDEWHFVKGVNPRRRKGNKAEERSSAAPC